MDWPKGPTYWIDNRILYASIPFTWNLISVKGELSQRNFDWDTAIVGGPAVELIPGFFNDLPHVSEGHDAPGILQRINPLATRTTIGCNRKCKFCGVGRGKIEQGGLVELDDWPDLPVLCDNNILASSEAHFDKVIERLKGHGWADFNQGIDARLLTPYHAKRLREIGKPIIRLALDNMGYADQWENAFSILRSASFPLNLIRSYALVGFDSTPEEAWIRCKWIEDHKVIALPMWFHKLNAMEVNQVTKAQKTLGWSDYERRRIMQWYYQHKKAKKGDGE